ncbi:MAG: hypothetical protein ACK2UB_05460 [Anaerolineales bacterium]|jgi:hypothetical protein
MRMEEILHLSSGEVFSFLTSNPYTPSPSPEVYSGEGEGDGE